MDDHIKKLIFEKTTSLAGIIEVALRDAYLTGYWVGYRDALHLPPAPYPPKEREQEGDKEAL